MRFSGYNILSPKLSTGDYVLLNGVMGTLDLIDEEAYELISSHSDDEELSEEVLDMMEDIKDRYIDRGYLTDYNRDEEIDRARDLACEMIKSRDESRWGVVLVPNLGCNYRCTYCFEKGGGYPEITMTREQVDSIFEIIKDKIGHEEELTLYGGEPLAKENKELLTYIVNKGVELNCHFFAVTNGHDIEHYIDLLGNDKISALQITLDGPREIHNKRRISLDGESSYDRILSNIELVTKKTDVQIGLRINLDKRNYPYMIEFLDELDRRGIIDNPSVSIVANSVIGEDDVLIKAEKIRALENAVSQKYSQFDWNFTSFTSSSNKMLLSALYFGEPIIRRPAACAASGSMKVFAPDGKIYSCWSAIGYSEHVIGTYDYKGNVIWNNVILDEWAKKSLIYDKECIICKYAFLCAGGCRRPKLVHETHTNSKECDFYKNLFTEYLARATERYLAIGE